MSKPDVVPFSFPVLDAPETASKGLAWNVNDKPKVQRLRFGADATILEDEPEPVVAKPPREERGAVQSTVEQDASEQALSAGDREPGAFDTSEGSSGLPVSEPPPRPSIPRNFAAEDVSSEIPSSSDFPPPSLSMAPGVLPNAGMPRMLEGLPSLSDAPPAPAPKRVEIEAFAKAAIELAAAREVALAEIEHQLLTLAVSIAQSIIEREVEHNPELYAALARTALKTIHDPNGSTLRASREAYAAILDVFNEPMITYDNARVRVELDPTLEGLGVVAENAHVRVDGRVSERLRMVLRAMDDERRRAELETKP